MQDETTHILEDYYILATSTRADERTRVIKHGDSFGVFDHAGMIRQAGIGELGPHLLSQQRVTQTELAFGRRERQRVAKARHLVEQERRPEREVHALAIGCEHRMQLEAVPRGRLRELQTALPTVGRVGHRAQRVEMYGSTRRAGHSQHEIAIGVAVAVEERARNELDRSAAELGQHARQRNQFVG
jgi:hypothetical protein